MEPMNELTQRKSPRAEWLEYNDGRYFVTVCTHERQSFLGDITNGVMTMTEVGRYLDGLLSDATSHQSYIHVLQHVVMPNHFHAIVEVDSGDDNHVGTRHGVSAENIKNADASCKCRDAINCVRETNNEQTDAMYIHVGTQHDASVENIKNADASCRVPTEKGYKLSKLSFFIGMLKSAVTRYARANGIPFAWQSRYHDHAIRGVDDNNNISQYIENNVLNWEKDCFY